MQVQVSFTVDVDWCDEKLGDTATDKELATRVENAVSEAICNAIRYAEGEGHRHKMDEEIAILLDGIVRAKIIDHNDSEGAL